MAYNTGQQKHRSLHLEGLDCGNNIKAVPQDDHHPEAWFTASATRVVAIGECVAMLRIPANTVILGAEFFWDEAAPAAIVAIGDPYACARLLGPIHTGTPRGMQSTSTCSGFVPYGSCGTLMKMGRTTTGHEGCGFGYRYTCETDLTLTNLYSDALAQVGGWAGGGTVASSVGQASVAITAGTYGLILHVKKATTSYQ